MIFFVWSQTYEPQNYLWRPPLLCHIKVRSFVTKCPTPGARRRFCLYDTVTYFCVTIWRRHIKKWPFEASIYPCGWTLPLSVDHCHYPLLPDPNWSGGRWARSWRRRWRLAEQRAASGRAALQRARRGSGRRQVALSPNWRHGGLFPKCSFSPKVLMVATATAIPLPIPPPFGGLRWCPHPLPVCLWELPTFFSQRG